MVRTKSFDVSEMSLAHYLTESATDDFPFVGLPIFPSRFFRHGFFFVNAKAGIETPKDLEGRRVGLRDYKKTAAVWLRGILQHDYGVAIGSIRWFEGGFNDPRPPDAAMDLKPAGPITIEYIPEGRSLSDMLATGEIDATLGALVPNSIRTSPDVVRLFPNFREVEREYFDRTRIFPIMHCLVMPEKIESLFGGDAWPYGLEPNRTTLETLVQYLADQHFLSQPVRIEDMFTPIVGDQT